MYNSYIKFLNTYILLFMGTQKPVQEWNNDTLKRKEIVLGLVIINNIDTKNFTLSMNILM